MDARCKQLLKHRPGLMNDGIRSEEQRDLYNNQPRGRLQIDIDNILSIPPSTRTDAVVSSIERWLRKNCRESIITSLSVQKRMALARRCCIRRFHKGDMLYSEGDEGSDDLFILIRGAASLWQHPRHKKSFYLSSNLDPKMGERIGALYQQGDVFEHVALVCRAPNATSARAESNLDAIQVSVQVYNNLVERKSIFPNSPDSSFVARRRKIASLACLSNVHREAESDLMFTGTMENVARGKCLYRQGGAARSIYFLLEGTVQLVFEVDIPSSELGKIRIPIAQKASGQLLGSSCAASERQHLLTALAETSLQVLRVSLKELALFRGDVGRYIRENALQSLAWEREQITKSAASQLGHLQRPICNAVANARRLTSIEAESERRRLERRHLKQHLDGRTPPPRRKTSPSLPNDVASTTVKSVPIHVIQKKTLPDSFRTAHGRVMITQGRCPASEDCLPPELLIEIIKS